MYRMRREGKSSGKPKLSDVSLRSCRSVASPIVPRPMTTAGTSTALPLIVRGRGFSRLGLAPG